MSTTELAPGSAPARELLRLLQLSSSLCPIGAFAFSQGLEQAVERGWVSDEAALGEWLLGLGRHALALLDLPLLMRAHAAWKASDSAAALRVTERLLAQREARELWEQERDLGQALCAVLDNLGVPEAASLRQAPLHSYVVCYALGAAHFGLSAELAALGYAFAWSEQQANAAARLVPLGHMATQRVLSRVLADVPEWMRRAQSLTDEEIGSVAPGLAMAAAWHETQYTRLFRS
ncbi:MAG TPA: urease accessory UreF family protein [Polyangiaceae bacterium]|nr:urease accessory UreF family protein [Polyangiaceae bacterium]